MFLINLMGEEEGEKDLKSSCSCQINSRIKTIHEENIP